MKGEEEGPEGEQRPALVSDAHTSIAPAGRELTEMANVYKYVLLYNFFER